MEKIVTLMQSVYSLEVTTRRKTTCKKKSEIMTEKRIFLVDDETAPAALLAAISAAAALLAAMPGRDEDGTEVTVISGVLHLVTKRNLPLLSWR